MTARSRTFLAMRDDDSGMALVFVVLSMLVVIMFATAGLAYAASSQSLSRHDQDWNAALAAAQGGVDDFIAHLNRNDNYARTTFTDCGNLAMKGPKAPLNSCGWGSTTPAGWTPVTAGAGLSTKRAYFHYDINASSLDYSGTIDVKSTGAVNGVRRTLEVAVGRGGSTDFLYYTDHEDADPDNVTAYPNGADARCSSYWYGDSAGVANSSTSRSYYEGLSRNRASCSEIEFVGGDVLDGKVHTNDTPMIAGKATFKQGFETSDPECKSVVAGNSSTYSHCDRDGDSTANPQFGSTYGPVYADPLFPPDNSGGFSNYPGCDYTGATRIIFKNDGTMTVWSKNTTSANSTTTAACGGNAPWNTTVAVPSDQVIYVRNGGSTVHECAAGEIDGTLPLAGYLGANGSKPGYYNYDELSNNTSDQYCGQGNVYLEGSLKGRVTVAAENSIVLTGNVTLSGGTSGTDLLGLVATNSVEVYHPVFERYSCAAYNSVAKTCTTFNTSPDTSGGALVGVQENTSWPHDSSTGLEVDGSIQTLQHSFYVQNYNLGSFQGQLNVFGSLAQKWRGIVGTGGSGGTGYLKNYQYDVRLKYSSPPYFPQWQNSVWSPRQTGEIASPGASSTYPDPS